MTAFARKVLGGAARHRTCRGRRQQLLDRCRSSPTTPTRPAARSTCRSARALSLFGRYGWRDLNTDDQPTIPLPSGGGGNGDIYARNKQFVLGATCVPTRPSLLEVALRLVEHARPARIRRRSASPSALDAVRHRRACRPTPRIAGGLPTQIITGYSDLGRQATNPQWQYPDRLEPEDQLHVADGPAVVQGRLRVPAHRHRSAGREPALRPRHLQRASSRGRPAPRANNLYNLADFMLGLRVAVRAQQRARRRTCGSNMHFVYLQDDLRVNDQLTLNLGLRYEYATPLLGSRTTSCRTSIRSRERDDHGEGRIDLPIARSSIRTATTSGRGSASPTRWRRTTVIRGGYGISYVHFNRTGGGDILPINGPQVVNAVVNQTRRRRRRRSVPTEQGYPAGLTDPSQFNPLTANITYMPRDYHSSPVQSWYISVQRELVPQHAARRRLRRQQGRRPAAVRQLQPGGAEQRRRHAPAAVAAADPGRSPTSPTRSTAASRATRRCRRSSSGA